MDMLYCKLTAQVAYAGFVREEIANYLRSMFTWREGALAS